MNQDVPLISLANIFQNARLWEDALTVARMAVEIAPHFVVNHFTLANVYITMVMATVKFSPAVFVLFSCSDMSYCWSAQCVGLTERNFACSPRRHPVFVWVSSWCSGIPHHQKHLSLLNSLVSDLNRGTVLELELVPRRCTVAAHCS